MMTNEELRLAVIGYADSNSLDMADEIDTDTLFGIVCAIVDKAFHGPQVCRVVDVQLRKVDNIWVPYVTDGVFDDIASDDNDDEEVEFIRFNDICHTVSWSTTNCTGVSESCTKILRRDFDEYNIETLIDMLNEAWYNCKYGD